MLFLGFGFERLTGFFLGSTYLSFHNGDFGSDEIGDSTDVGEISEMIGSSSINYSIIYLTGFSLISFLRASLGTVIDFTPYFLTIFSLVPQFFCTLSRTTAYLTSVSFLYTFSTSLA